MPDAAARFIMPPSLPLWERGLKYVFLSNYRLAITVAPLVGAWIEIIHRGDVGFRIRVAPLVGAWIEMDKIEQFSYTD